MKQFYCYFCIGIFIVFPQTLFGQGLRNNGAIVNFGKISVLNHKSWESGAAGIVVNNGAGNEGTIVLTAARNIFSQDTLTGWIEFFSSSTDLPRQEINAKTFTKLRLTGSTLKQITSFTSVLDSAVIRSTVQSATLEQAELRALGGIIHSGVIKPDVTLICAGTNLQTFDGNGVIGHLVVNNPAGIRLDTRAKIELTNSITLLHGIVRNSAMTNVHLADNALITRTSKGAFLSAPLFQNAVNLRYIGDFPIQSGEELPHDSNRVRTLAAMNAHGVTLQRNAYVLDSVIMSSVLYTNKFMLALQSPNAHVVFSHDSSRINGTFRRQVSFSDTLPTLFHNRYTWLQSSKPQAGLRYAALRIESDTPPEPDANTTKVRRTFALQLFDEQYRLVRPDTTSIFRFGYAWQKQTPDETNNLRVEKVLLQRWVNVLSAGEWKTVGTPRYRRLAWNVASAGGFWYHGETDSIRGSELSGNFALGMDSAFGLLPATLLQISLILEGVHLGNGQMTSRIAQKQLLPTKLPAMYPYTLLGERRGEIIASDFTPGTVDWIILELRHPPGHRSDSSIFLPALLMSDGRLVQPRGGMALRLSRNEEDTTRWYHCIVHHRNHLGIMSAMPLFFRPSDTVMLSFTRPEFVRGGTEAMKFLGLSGNGRPIWGLAAGDVNADGMINRSDYDVSPVSAWSAIFFTGYLPADVFADGIVTTKDLNLIWNNRGKLSFLPQR